MKKDKIIVKIAISCVALLFIGCGGSGSGENDTPSSKTVSGIVSDPAIEGSYVKLCLKNDIANCLDYATLTDNEGKFEISNIGTSYNLNQYVIVATGGTDTVTGEGFDGVSLTVPVDELTSSTNAMVTPITSLLHANGWTKTQLATNLGINQADILKDPSTDVALQKKAMILTQIAKNTSDADKFKTTNLSGGNLDNVINTKITDLSKKAEVLAIKETIEDKTTLGDITKNIAAIKAVMESDEFVAADKTDANVIANAKTWATNIITALTTASITTPNYAQIKAVRNATTVANFSSASPTLTIDTSTLSLADIRPSKTLYDHTKALSVALGNDSDKKREYYYQSTASYLNQMETIIKSINDTSITDAIYVDIAQGYIIANEIDRALAYAKNNIFKKENKADVYREVGEKLIDTNNTKAEELFDNAFALYKEVTNAKGAGNMKNTDIFDYRYLLKDYSSLGKTTKATAVTDYITSKTTEFTTTTQYGSYIVGMTQVAEELIEKGEITEAVAILDDAWILAQNSPANNAPTGATSTQHYKAKVYYALSIAGLYVKAGSSYYTKANTITDAMQALRLDDGNSANGTYSGTIVASSSGNDTSVQTKAYIGDLVAIYAATGEDEKALAVIQTATQTSYVQAGYIEYALGLAKKDSDLTNAFNIIDTNIVSYSDQLKALTYNGINKLGVYIAQYMIENNQNVKAKQAIDKAVTILETKITANTETTDTGKSTNYVKYGYSKFANLYAIIGETTLANTYFDKAIAIANGTASSGAITVAVSQVDAMAQIVSHLNEVGYTTKATSTLSSAFDIAKTITTTKDKLTNMQKLITTDGNYASKEIIIDEIKSLIDTNSGLIGETTNEANYKKSVDYLVKMGEILGQIGKKEKAKTMLEATIIYANQITVPADRVTKLTNIVKGYAALGFVTEAKTTADMIAYGADRRKAIAEIAIKLYSNDAFSECSVATIDTDGDGKPEFYDYGATSSQISSCGLTLDDDSDGDGKDDTIDKTPFYKGND